mmetsp:Transcript_12481/g.25415  ORF Transcript_12481/g.25415 Transcript_12481/m.25415 type:complete len:1063 (+) Transcript_12481:142-3330(+)
MSTPNFLSSGSSPGFEDPFADLIGDGLKSPEGKKSKMRRSSQPTHGTAQLSALVEAQRRKRIQMERAASTHGRAPNRRPSVKKDPGFSQRGSGPRPAKPVAVLPKGRAPPIPGTPPPSSPPNFPVPPGVHSAPKRSPFDREKSLGGPPQATAPVPISPGGPWGLNGKNPFESKVDPFGEAIVDDDMDDDIDFSKALPMHGPPRSKSLPPTATDPKLRWKEQIQTLKEMGFKNEKEMVECLERYNGDVSKCLNVLVHTPKSKQSTTSKTPEAKETRRKSIIKSGPEKPRSKTPVMNRPSTAASRDTSEENPLDLVRALQHQNNMNQRPPPRLESEHSPVWSDGDDPAGDMLRMLGLMGDDKHNAETSTSTSIERMESLKGFGGGPLSASTTFVEEDSMNTNDGWDFGNLSELFGPAASSDATPKTATGKEWSKSETEKRKRNREKVVQEIISTEKTYCNGLEKLIKNFVYPLQGQVYTKSNPSLQPSQAKAESKGGSSRRYSVVIRQESQRAMTPTHKKQTHKAVIEKGDAIRIFSNIELIYRLNQTFLMNLEDKPKQVGQTFHDFAQYFKMYMPYVQNHDHATAKLSELMKQSRSFRNALSKQEKEAKSPLQSLLILPIQRIPRYKLLLETLIKNTHPSNPSYSGLKKDLDVIKKVAAHIDSSITSREEAKKLAEIQGLFHGNVELVAPHRKFIMRQKMKKVTKSGTLVDREFFLFNDMLLYGTDDVTFSKQLRLRQVMPIDKSFLLSEVQKYGQSGHLLYVSSSVKNITISFHKEADKEKWKRSLTACMEKRRHQIGFNYHQRGHVLLRQAPHQQAVSTGPVFTSYHYGAAAEEKSKDDRAFYELMRRVDLTRKYFESLYKQTKLYLAEQQSLIKQSSAFALKVKGDVGLQAPWYRALLATSNMVAVHSHEMLRWKSVTELLIDSITFVLKGPVTKAEQKKASYAKQCSELAHAKRSLDSSIAKNPKSTKVKSGQEALITAAKEFKKSKDEAIKGVKDMDAAIQKGFLDKLRLFVQVQADYHKDCYYDIRQCWTHLHKGRVIAPVRPLPFASRSTTDESKS